MSKRIVLVIAMVWAIVGMSINTAVQGTYYRRSCSYGLGSYGAGSSRAIEYAKAQARDEAKRKDNNVKTEERERQTKTKTDNGNETVSSQNNDKIIVQVSEEKVVTRSGKIFYKHIVSERQSISLISNAYGVTVNDIYEANPTAKKGLKIGQTLMIPAKVSLETGDKEISKEAKPAVLSDSSQETKPSSVTSNHKDEVSLVVDGEGPDKTEATKNALRSAIEQAYGTFVSANTTILNDDLVKDEIVTVSSGNIKSYKELSSTILSNGQTSVTLAAVVSIGQLISYAQSKGASAEFAGQSFMMNMKMRELNKKNEEMAINHLVEKLESISNTFYDYSIELGEPQETVFYRSSHAKYGLTYSTNKDCFGTLGFGQVSKTQGYKLSVTLTITLNENYKKWSDDFINVLSTVSLSEDEVKQYGVNNTPCYEFRVFDYRNDDIKKAHWYEDASMHFVMRNDYKDLIKKICYILNSSLNIQMIEKHSDGTEKTYSNCFLDNSSKNGLLYSKEGYNLILENPLIPWTSASIYPQNRTSWYSYKKNIPKEERGWKYKIQFVYEGNDISLLSGIEVLSE